MLLLVMASVRGDREGAPDGVCKGIGHSLREHSRTKSLDWVSLRRAEEERAIAHWPACPPSPAQPAVTTILPSTIHCVGYPSHHLLLQVLSPWAMTPLGSYIRYLQYDS